MALMLARYTLEKNPREEVSLALEETSYVPLSLVDERVLAFSRYLLELSRLFERKRRKADRIVAEKRIIQLLGDIPFKNLRVTEAQKLERLISGKKGVQVEIMDEKVRTIRISYSPQEQSLPPSVSTATIEYFEKEWTVEKVLDSGHCVVVSFYTLRKEDDNFPEEFEGIIKIARRKDGFLEFPYLVDPVNRKVLHNTHYVHAELYKDSSKKESLEMEDLQTEKIEINVADHLVKSQVTSSISSEIFEVNYRWKSLFKRDD